MTRSTYCCSQERVPSTNSQLAAPLEQSSPGYVQGQAPLQYGGPGRDTCAHLPTIERPTQPLSEPLHAHSVMCVHSGTCLIVYKQS